MAEYNPEMAPTYTGEQPGSIRKFLGELLGIDPGVDRYEDVFAEGVPSYDIASGDVRPIGRRAIRYGDAPPMPLDLEEGGPSAALEPSFDPIPARWQSPSRFKKVASVDTAPRHASGSLLDKVKFLGGGGGGIGGGGMGAGTTAPGTAGSRGQEIFGPMDPVFKGAPRANQGGLVSLCPPNKPRQMVS